MDTRADINELRNASVLINTADYCHTTALEVSLTASCLYQVSFVAL